MSPLIHFLYLVTLAGAFPGDRKRWNNIFDRDLDKYHPRQDVDDHNCRQLGHITHSCVRYAFFSDYYRFPVAIETKDASYYGNVGFGFDIFEDEAAWEELACSIARAHTVSELKDILDTQNDFNFRQFRLAYNYIVVVYVYTVNYLSARGDELETLKSLGLLSLDPELIRYMADGVAEENSNAFDMENYLTGPGVGNVQERCQKLQDMIWNRMPLIPSAIKKKFLWWTGINLNDKHRVNTILCDIVKAADMDLKSVYKVLDDDGLVDIFYQKLYPIIVRKTAKKKEELENEIQSLEQQISTMDPADIEYLYHEADMMMYSLVVNFFLQLKIIGLLDLV